MLDDLYENIGGKIKNWAKWIFIVEVIGAIITGIILLSEAKYDEIFILYGLLTIICGPIVAYVGSWILYAFGELVEKTCDNEYNTRQICKQLTEKGTNNIIFAKSKENVEKASATPQPTPSSTSTTTSTPTHKWLCGGCKK